MCKCVDVFALAVVCCLAMPPALRAAEEENVASSVLPLEAKASAPSVASFSTAGGSTTIVPSKVRDPAFERLVDLGLLRSAIDSGDASQLTDVALQFVEGERILLRPHRDITAEQLLRLAGKAAVVKQDRRTLERLVKASTTQENDKLASEMESMLKTLSASRTSESALMVPVDTPIDVFLNYQELIKAIDRARILGDRETMESLERQLTLVRGLSKEQTEYLKKIMNSARSSVPEKADPWISVLMSLAAPSRQQGQIPPQAPTYGPGQDSWMNHGSTFRIILPPGRTLQLTFSSNAWFENEGIIYNERGDWSLRRGNYGMGLEPWSYRNESGQNMQFVVSAWHKDGPYPSARLPWHQSPMKVFNNQLGSGIIGFPDAETNPGTAVVVRYFIQ